MRPNSGRADGGSVHASWTQLPALYVAFGVTWIVVTDLLTDGGPPQFELRSGRLVGFEVLARWTHPVQGPISPARFIQMAEDAAIIDALTERVLDRAITFAARIGHGASGPRVAVNVSGRSLTNDTLIATIVDALERHGVHPSRLEVELTETAPDRARTRVAR